MKPPVCWKVGPTDVRIQVYEPAHAEKLSRVSGVRLVAESAAGEYLRVFAARKPMRWAKYYVERLTRTNARFCEPALAQSDNCGAGMVMVLGLGGDAPNRRRGEEIEAMEVV